MDLDVIYDYITTSAFLNLEQNISLGKQFNYYININIYQIKRVRSIRKNK